MVGRLYRLPPKEAKARAADVLERFGLTDAADRRVSTYSGGMRRRLDLGASLTGQYAAVDEVLTGRENLRMMARLRHLPGAAGRARADELLAQFDLADAADRRASTYSGGMRRRLDIAMSLVARPVVLFLDEPTTGLDLRSRRNLWATIATLTAEGVTVLLTTQYLEEADQLRGPTPGLAARQIEEAGDEDEVVRAGQRLVDRRVLPGEPDPRPHLVGVRNNIDSRHHGATRVRLQQGRQDAHRGRLAGAVRSEQAEHGPARHVQVDSIEGPGLPEGLHEPLGDDRGVVPICVR
jgi:ABC-type Na+ transport system ATPase subunit NatA